MPHTGQRHLLMIETIKIMDGQFIGLAVKTLIVILVITILISTAVFYYRDQYQREWQGTALQGSEKSGFTDFYINTKNTTPNINYVLWIGDVATTLDILNLAQQPGMVIQPIYIPDPMNSSARTEYELQITRTLRVMINTKYQQSQILPIISITRERPDDTAFNNEYDHLDNTRSSDTSTRENILRRWAKYYKFTITNTNTGTNISQRTINTNKQTQTQKQTQKQKQKSNANILSETWNCRFPVGNKGTPCGLCKKCEKLNSLSE